MSNDINLSELISNNISHQIQCSYNMSSNKDNEIQQLKSQNQLNDLVDDLRILYLQVFDQQEHFHQDDIYWAKKQFMLSSSITELIQKQNNNNNNTTNDTNINYKYEFSVDKTMYEYDTKTTQTTTITIGSYQGCDICIDNNDNTLSRLHAIVLLYPQLNKVIVCDVGSRNGIKTIKRSDEKKEKKELIHSLPGYRNVLEFAYNEGVVLELGSTIIHLLNKYCIICNDQARNTLFEKCHHYCTCIDCYIKLDNCPLCREPKRSNIISVINEQHHFNTNVQYKRKTNNDNNNNNNNKQKLS